MSRDEYRKKIDRVDGKIQELLEERFTLSKKIGTQKFQKGLPVKDGRRETAILGRISGRFGEEIREIYRLILQKSREIQKFAYFLTGKNLAHSFSPLVYEIFGLSNYGLFETDDFREVLGKDFRAINVTNPHKRSAYLACTQLSEEARKTGTVNLMVRAGEGFFGDNTDYHGFLALLDHYGIVPQGKKFLVIGNGASARTVFHSLKERGAAAVQIIARNTKSADEAKLGEYRKFSDFEFVVNATPYGNYPENALEPLFPLQDFRNLEGAIDLNYNPALTPLLREAKSCGAKTADGLYMLVAQAARNLARFGFSPEISISEVYREMRLHRANIVLIGMPHSGKSTLGKALSEVLGKEFVDIDQRLEARGRDLGSLYPDVEAFRKEEAEETIRHAKGWNQVIACGGGIVLNPEAIAHLQGNGVLVFLDASLDELLARLDGTRPLIQSEEDLVRTYRERINLYRRHADITVKTGTEIKEITEKIYEYFGN